MAVYMQFTRSGFVQTCQYDGMDLATVTKLLTDLGATGITEIKQSDFAAAGAPIKASIDAGEVKLAQAAAVTAAKAVFADPAATADQKATAIAAALGIVPMAVKPAAIKGAPLI